MSTTTHARCQCGQNATVYAVDPIPDGWGAYFCHDCKPTYWQILDYIPQPDSDNNR